jgi:hypothetical protein
MQHICILGFSFLFYWISRSVCAGGLVGAIMRGIFRTMTNIARLASSFAVVFGIAAGARAQSQVKV